MVRKLETAQLAHSELEAALENLATAAKFIRHASREISEDSLMQQHAPTFRDIDGALSILHAATRNKKELWATNVSTRTM